MLQAKPDVRVLVEGAFPRHLDVGRLERYRLVRGRLWVFSCGNTTSDAPRRRAGREPGPA